MDDILIVPTGKIIRAPFLFQTEQPIVISPIDDYLIFGPKDGLESPLSFVPRITNAHPDAILTHAGLVERHGWMLKGTRTIINLSASTTLKNHVCKRTVHGVETALRLHANAVAYHININSDYCSEMMESASAMIEEARRYDLPCLGIIYPRDDNDPADARMMSLKASDPKAFAELVSHCVSIAVSLGFDAVKTWYTDHEANFANCVSAAGGMPILIAGGPKTEAQNALRTAQSAMRSGAAGVSYGRNLFGRQSPNDFISQLREMKRRHEV